MNAPADLAPCGRCGQVHGDCNGHNRAGGPCGRNVRTGLTVCPTHGGLAPQVLAAGQRREQQAWAVALRDSLEHPPEVEPNAALLGELYRTQAFVGWLQATLVEAASPEAAIDAWHEELLRERKHLLDVAKAAIALGLAEREVRIVEQHAQLVAAVIRAILNDPELGLSRDQHDRASTVVHRHLVAIAAQAA